MCGKKVVRVFGKEGRLNVGSTGGEGLSADRVIHTLHGSRAMCRCRIGRGINSDDRGKGWTVTPERSLPPQGYLSCPAATLCCCLWLAKVLHEADSIKNGSATTYCM